MAGARTGQTDFGLKPRGRALPPGVHRGLPGAEISEAHGQAREQGTENSLQIRLPPRSTPGAMHRDLVQIKAREEGRLRRTSCTPQGAPTSSNAELRQVPKHHTSITSRTSGSMAAPAPPRVSQDTPKNTRMESTSAAPDTVTPVGKLYILK